MRSLLMFCDRDFDPAHTQQPGETDLVHDLDLATLWAAAADGDEVVHASVRAATLQPLTDPCQITYRCDVVSDCLAQPAVARELYKLAGHALKQEREIYRASFFSHSSTALLARSVTAMRLFVVVLKNLRAVADQHADDFVSPALTRLLRTARAELADSYFTEIDEHLRTLRFHDGIMATAQLGRHNQGVNYTLRVPRKEHQSHLLPRRPPVKAPHYSRTVPRDDDAGLQDLAALRDRILTLAADAIADAAQHILAFLTALRSELGFYIGCLNLHDLLTARGLPMCRPDPQAADTAARSARGLYDPCLGLRSPVPVQGSDLSADGKTLILITGANQGGKSTFLRSVGLAHLMMQAGMPVAARSFTAATVTTVLTHYTHEEDATMTAGKLDEELRRMSEITHHIRAHGLLLCNESFAATNEREAADIAEDILRALQQAGITVVFVTHLYELAHRLSGRSSGQIMFLRADRDGQERRHYQLCEGAPLPTSYGQDLYRRTFEPREPSSEADPAATATT